MDDLAKVWRLFLAVLHFIFQAIFTFATTSSAGVGIALIAMAVLVRLYHRRQTFYGGLDVASDWAPRYGDIVSARTTDFALKWVFRIVLFFGLMVLFNWWLPQLFRDIFGFLIRVTGA